MLVLQPGESDRRKVPAETGTKNDWRLCDVPRIGSANSRKTAGRKPNKTSDLQGGKIAAREPPPRAAIDCRAHLNGWRGAVAQMGERCNRTAEVRGSIPLSSTSLQNNGLSPRRLETAACEPHSDHIHPS